MSGNIAPKLWIIASDDNVGTVVGSPAPAGVTLPMIGAATGRIALSAPIPHGHKVALTAMPPGTNIVKYGVVIGRLANPVAAGEHVHTHNLQSLRGRGDLGNS
jgi:altronate dehydratase small subunit